MTVLAIQSQVAYGHVGNSAGAFALQRLGIDVWPVPTVVLSHHPGHGGSGGGALASAFVADVLRGLVTLGRLGECGAALTGYLGSAANGVAALAAIAALREANPEALYLCDPVLGDRDTGLYVARDLPDFFLTHAMPRADIATPNQFELERLTGQRVSTIESALYAAEALRALGPRTVIVTSLERADAGEDVMETLAVGVEGAWLVRNPRIAKVPHGAGDLLASLFLGHYLKSRDVPAALARAVASTYGVLLTSADLGLDELSLVQSQDEIVAPSTRFEPARLR
jgi:pyridoxine kinase